MLTIRRRIRFSVFSATFIAACSWVIAADVVQRQENFGTDPSWEGRNNTPDPTACVTKTQDFGFSRTKHAGGKLGEIGGVVSRSLTPASYMRRIPVRTLNDRLHASGRFAVTESHAGSGVLLGWFHSTSRGWRTPNSLALRIDGEQGSFRVFFEYGTQTGKTGGGQTFKGRYQDSNRSLHPADGTSHRWSLDYHPAGANGQGAVTCVLDGNVYRATLHAGHKAEATLFNRFGLMNVQTSGSGLTVWLDDLRIDGQREEFDTDPR